MSDAHPTRGDAELLAGAFDGAHVSEALGEITLDVEPADVPAVLARAIDAGYDFLCDLAATDHLGFGGAVAGYWSAPAHAVVDQDMNLSGSGGLGSRAPELGPRASRSPTSCSPASSSRCAGCACAPGSRTASPCRAPSSVFPCADYLEREAFDLMGIPFAGHPNLERIFLPEGWDGHPHRKDYPIGGEPVQFSDAV